MNDTEFYNALDDLAERALASGLDRATVILDLRLLATALENEDRDR